MHFSLEGRTLMPQLCLFRVAVSEDIESREEVAVETQHIETVLKL